MSLLSKHRALLGIVVLVFIALQICPAYAGKRVKWRRERTARNESGKRATDLHLVFTESVRQVRCADNDFVNERSSEGKDQDGNPKPSDEWTLDGGKGCPNQGFTYFIYGQLADADPDARIKSAQWSFPDPNDPGGFIYEDMDPNHFGYYGILEEVIYNKGSQPKTVTPRFRIQNTHAALSLEMDNFQVWIANDPEGVGIMNYQTPTGTLVSGLPSSFTLAPGQMYDTLDLPDMPEDFYALFLGDLTRDGETMEMASGYYIWPLCDEFVPGDTNEDCYVDLDDFVALCAGWLDCSHELDPACIPAGP